MGEIQKRPFQLSFNASQGRVPRLPRHFGRWPNPGARTRRAARIRRIDQTTSERLAWEERAVWLRRPVAAIDLLPPGWLRRPQRHREAFPGPDVPANQFGKDMRSRRRSPLAVAEFRDRDAGRGRELRRAGGTQPGIDSKEIPVHGRQEQSAYNGHFESTCCFYSTETAIVWRQSCVQATCTAQRAGRNFCCRRSSGNRS